MSNEDIKTEDTSDTPSVSKKKKTNRGAQRIRKQKQIIVILVVLIGGLGIFQLQASLDNKVEHIDENIYTALRFDMPIKQTLEIITIENKGNDKLFNNQNNKIEYSDIKNYREDNLDRYIAYHALHPELLEAEVIWKVNANFDYEPYSNIIMIEDGNNILSVVNKNAALFDWFVPEDLVELEGTKTKGMLVRSDVNESFTQLLKALEKAELTIDVINAYEDYNSINSVYRNLVETEGVEAADQKGVRAGHSEHQLGLAIDVSDGSDRKFSETDTYHWLKSNAHRFGFIFRYDRSESDTGYPQEANHLRYVGKETAIDMYEKNIVIFEEYLDKHGA